VIEVQFDKADYANLFEELAHSLKARVTDNFFQIPPVYGNGYVWYENLPVGISVWVWDIAFRDEVKITGPAIKDDRYVLQFNESDGGDMDKAPYLVTNTKTKIPLLHSSILLSDVETTKAFVIPVGVKLKSVHIYFDTKILATYLAKDAVEILVKSYFPQLIANAQLDPIETDYRVMLDELQVDKHDHPLRINFIQNRVLLLLEKFLLKLAAHKKTLGAKSKLTEDEIVRLMKVEALLVKDFSVAVPTIDSLSKLSAMSPTKLKSDFKQLYGLPIYEYYQKNRMLKAKALLLSGLYSSKEVGIMVGYTNLSHFATTFKKEFGVLPSELFHKDGSGKYSD